MLWTDAWIADTHHLSVELRGAYMDLLVLMWRTPGCRVPNDDRWLAHHLGYSAEQVAHLIRPIINEFCTSVAGDEFIMQKRLQREFRRCTEHKEKRASRARAGWKKRKGDAYAMHPSPAPAPAPAHSTVQVQEAEGLASLASAPRGALAREAESAPPDPPEIRDAAIDRVRAAMMANGFPLNGRVRAKRTAGEE